MIVYAGDILRGGTQNVSYVAIDTGMILCGCVKCLLYYVQCRHNCDTITIFEI